MHDWTYEPLIRKLKAALAEVETEPDPPPAAPSLNDANDPEASTARADTTRQMKGARKASS
jgi:hypothetical protein